MIIPPPPKTNLNLTEEIPVHTPTFMHTFIPNGPLEGGKDLPYYWMMAPQCRTVYEGVQPRVRRALSKEFEK